MGVQLSPEFPHSLNQLRKCRACEYSWFRATCGKCHKTEPKGELSEEHEVISTSESAKMRTRGS